MLQKATASKQANEEATALEKIQVEVAGSYGLDGKIDIEQLNTNLKRISGLKYKENTLSESNKITKLSAVVNLDGYTFTISDKGSVDKLIWVNNEDGSFTNTKTGDKLTVGDYIKYEDILPTVTLTAETQIIKDIKEYSENSTSTDNTESTIKQEKNTLKWRFMDIKDDEIRLISDCPTQMLLYLEGYNGYNNGVYLLDELCNLLYSSNKSTAQNLKIEDIQEKLNKDEFDYTQYENIYADTHKYGGIKVLENKNLKYPKFYKNEIGCKEIDGVVNNGTEGISTQTKQQLVLDIDSATSKLKTQQTYWQKELGYKYFNNSKYYKLFLPDNMSNYWISSRCVDSGNDKAIFKLFKGRRIYNRWR